MAGIAMIVLLIILLVVIILAVILSIKKKESGKSVSVTPQTYVSRRQPGSNDDQLAGIGDSSLNVLYSNVGNELFVIGSNISYGIQRHEGGIDVHTGHTDNQDTEYVDVDRVGYVARQDGGRVAGDYLKIVSSFEPNKEPAEYEVMVPSTKPTGSGIQTGSDIQTQGIYEEVL